MTANVFLDMKVMVLFAKISMSVRMVGMIAVGTQFALIQMDLGLVTAKLVLKKNGSLTV